MGGGRFKGAKQVSLKELAFHCERRGLLRSEGVSDPYGDRGSRVANPTFLKGLEGL
jgi:hypothetical protein